MATAQWTNLATLKEAALRVLGSVQSQKLEPTADDQEDAIRDALDELGKVRPDVRVTEVAGDGTKKRFVLETEISGFDDELSAIQELFIVSDTGTNDETKTEVAPGDYELREQPTGELVLLILNGQVAGSSQVWRFTWTHPLEVNGLDGAAATTVAGRWKQALLLFIAERLAYLIARRASDLADNTLGIDQAEFRTFDERWSTRAKELRKRAEERLAPGEIGEASPGTAVEYESRSRIYGKRITH